MGFPVGILGIYSPRLQPNKKWLSEPTQNECSVCLDDMTTDSVKLRTECGQEFHAQCLYNWLDKENKCPICQRERPLYNPSTSVKIANNKQLSNDQPSSSIRKFGLCSGSITESSQKWTTSCGHSFHLICLHAHMKMESRCPTCWHDDPFGKEPSSMFDDSSYIP